MVFTNITPFPTVMTPITNITPLTYRDASTFLEYLETMKKWLNETLVPDSNAMIANAITEYQTGITNSEATVNEAKAGWSALFDQFMVNVTAEIATLNDAAVAGMVNDALTATGTAIRTLINDTAITPDEVDATAAAAINDTLSDLYAAVKNLIDTRNDETGDADTAAYITTTGAETRTATLALIDARNEETRDAKTATLFDTATTTRAAIDARITARADTAVNTVVSDAMTESGKKVRDIIVSRPVRSSGNRFVNIGKVRVPVTVSRYAAFPSVTVLRDGRLFAVWYEATDHEATRDGIVVGSFSIDQGKTWSIRHVIHTEAGVDLRDPSVSTSRDGKKIYLTYTKASAAQPRDGFFLKTSTDQGATFGAAVQIDDPALDGFGCSPVVELSNGTLFATWYARASTDGYDSVWYATSTDGGLSWNGKTKFKDGVADGRSYNEPCPAVYGDTIVILFRWGNSDGIGMTRSTNNGSTWTAPARMFTGTGRPQPVFTTEGTLITVYRLGGGQGGSSSHGMMKTSRDYGSTWTVERRVEEAAYGMWLYSGLAEVVPGQVLCMSSIETGTTSTDMSCRYLTEGGNGSPYGDTPPTALERATQRTTSVAAVDTFDRPDSQNIGRTDDGMLWTSTVANAQILDGAMQNKATTDVGIHLINVRTPNNEIEADLYWGSTAGVSLVFRYVDANNYFYVTTETLGTVLRLYKVEAGVITLLNTVNLNFATSLYYRVKVSNINTVIRVYFENELVITSTQGSQAGFFAGVKLGVANDSSAIHRVRNLVIRRRQGYTS